jgi:hypothetical protein
VYASVVERSVVAASRSTRSRWASSTASSSVSALASVFTVSSVASSGRPVATGGSETTDTVRSISTAISAPVPHISPSAIAALASPIASIAPSWNTGKYAVVPAVTSVVSRLPPCGPGVSVGTAAASVATPMVPITGSTGTAVPWKSMVPATSSTGVVRVNGCSTSSWSCSRPNPGVVTTRPRSSVNRTASISTASTSPGPAPSTAIGPVAALTASGIESSRSSSDWIVPSRLSTVSTVSDSPSSAVYTESIAGANS